MTPFIALQWKISSTEDQSEVGAPIYVLIEPGCRVLICINIIRQILLISLLFSVACGWTWRARLLLCKFLAATNIISQTDRLTEIELCQYNKINQLLIS
jgi:hypothetical protein